MMLRSKSPTFFCVALIQLFAAITALRAQEQTLFQLQLSLQTEEEHLNAPLKKFHTSYRVALQELGAKVQAAGDPTHIALVHEEIQGFAHNRVAPAGDFRELLELQGIYDRELAKITATSFRSMIELLRRYRISFRELENQLSRNGDSFEAAKAGRSADAIAARLERFTRDAGGAVGRFNSRVDIRSKPKATIRSLPDKQTLGTFSWDTDLTRNWKLEGPHPGRNDYYSVTVEGRFRAASTGQYTFSGYADDSFTLSIEGKAVGHIQSVPPGAETVIGVVPLEKGWHPFTLEYIEGVSDAQFALQVLAPGEKKARVITALELAGAATASP